MSPLVLLPYLGAAGAVAGSLVLAWLVKRGVRARLVGLHLGAAGPLWFLAAALVGSVFLALAVRCAVVDGLGLDRCIETHLLGGAGAVAAVADSLPIWPAVRLSAAVVAGTVAYALAALAFAWLIEPPPANEPGAPPPPSRGLPPSSAAPSARRAAAGPLSALDEAADAGVLVWLYRSLGSWLDPREGAEPRYRLWLGPALRASSWAKWLTLPLVAYGLGSAVAWVAAALILDALGQVLALPPAPAPTETVAAELEARPDEPAVSPSVLVSSLAAAAGPEVAPPRGLGVLPGRPQRHGQGRWPEGAGSVLWDEVLGSFESDEPGLRLEGAFRPWRHQYEAAARLLAGQDVLLESAPRSGRNTICRLLAAHEGLCRGGTVLWIEPTRSEAEAAVLDLLALGRRLGWHRAASCAVLVDRTAGALAPMSRQPTVLVSTVDDLESHLMPFVESWDLLLSSLSLVVVADVDAHHGPGAAALAGLCRRLSAVVRAAGASPRWIATASGLWPDGSLLAERILARPLSTVGPEEDGAPEPRRDVRSVAGWADLSARLSTVADGVGWRIEQLAPVPAEPRLAEGATVSGSEPAARSVADGRPTAVLLTADGAMLPRLRAASRHVPPVSPGEPSALVLWAPEPSALTTALLDRVDLAGPMPSWLGRGPAVAVALGNPIAAARDLRRALSEREVVRSELVETYGEQVVSAELEALAAIGSLSERRGATVSEHTGLPRPVRLLRLSDPSRPRSVGCAVTDNPVVVVDRSTRAPLTHVDRIRARAVLHPGMVLAVGGRRYRVPEDTGEDPVEVEPEGDPAWSVPVRVLEVEPLGWNPRRLVLGGTVVEGGSGPVRLALSVEGARRFGPDGRLLAERTFAEPRRCAYEARALLLRLPGPELTVGALHGALHLLRASLPLAVRAGPLDVDVALLPGSDGRPPGLAFVDLHPGGAGFTDVLERGALRRLVLVAGGLFRSCPEASGRLPCLSPFGALAEPDVEGAIALLEKLAS